MTKMFAAEKKKEDHSWLNTSLDVAKWQADEVKFSRIQRAVCLSGMHSSVKAHPNRTELVVVARILYSNHTLRDDTRWSQLTRSSRRRLMVPSLSICNSAITQADQRWFGDHGEKNRMNTTRKKSVQGTNETRIHPVN